MTAAMLDRQQRMEQCQGLVYALARQIRRKLPAYIVLEDLIEYGEVGLAEAARDFDAACGGAFSTFAYHRVRGAIYDGLSQMAWFSRSQYDRLRAERSAAVGAAEPAAEASPVEPSLEPTHCAAPRLPSMVYLSTAPEEAGKAGAAALVECSLSSPPAAAIRRETACKLDELIEALPQQQRTLIRATFFEGLTLQEAGRRLGMGKAWASRLRRRVLAHLRRGLQLAGAAP